MHAWHAYMKRMTLTIVYTVINETKNKEHAIEIISKCKVKWFIHDFKQYIQDINVKNNTTHWVLNATGPQWRELCDRLYYILFAASWYEYHKIEKVLKHYDLNNLKNGDINTIAINWSLFLPTLKYTVKYVTHKHMRRAYAAMFRQSVEIVHPSIIPPTIACIIHHYRNGYALSCNLDEEMVRNV